MCMPLGPRGAGGGGRRAYNTIDDVLGVCSLEEAIARYPDNEQATKEIEEYTKANIEHTQKWMIDDLYMQNICLLRVAAQPENLAAWNKLYRSLKQEKQAS